MKMHLPTQNHFQALFKMKHMNKQKTIFKTLRVSVANLIMEVCRLLGFAAGILLQFLVFWRALRDDRL